VSKLSMTPTVIRFRARRSGPEADLEDAIVPQLHDLFGERTTPNWVGRSIPVGAGLPDLVSASHRPELLAALSLTKSDGYLLAYLRTVSGARLETILRRTDKSERAVRKRLGVLAETGAVLERRGVFRIASAWRDILLEIVAVEAKISDWRAAVRQAARNRIFAHRAYVALPARLAHRVRHEPEFGHRGIGIIGVSNEAECTIVRIARHTVPIVWAYYYELAFVIGDSYGGGPK